MSRSPQPSVGLSDAANRRSRSLNVFLLCFLFVKKLFIIKAFV
ncbi:hypothetical protein [Coleofasciculus sp. FACHB-129]|nr:hypothetical protein [Coleofasciculus sp. FACHB-129]